MVRNYKRKTNKGLLDPEELLAAVREIRLRGVSLRNASSAHGIPSSTVRRYLKKIPLEEVMDESRKVPSCRVGFKHPPGWKSERTSRRNVTTAKKRTSDTENSENMVIKLRSPSNFLSDRLSALEVKRGKLEVDIRTLRLAKMSVREILSQRGKPMLVLNHHKYNMYRILSSGECQWRCNKHHCRAFLNTVDENGRKVITSKDENHVHEPYRETDIQRQVVTATAKRKLSEDLFERPSKIIRKCVEDTSSHDLGSNDMLNVQKRVYATKRKLLTTLPKTREEDPQPRLDTDEPPLLGSDFCEVVVKSEPEEYKPEKEEYSLAPGEPSTSNLQTEFDVVTICKNEIDDVSTMVSEDDPLAEAASMPTPVTHYPEVLSPDDLSYFQSLAADLNKLSLDQKMIFRIKVGNILRELVAA